MALIHQVLPSLYCTTNAPTLTTTVEISHQNMCEVLQQIASRAQKNFHCSTNQYCNGVDCTADLLNNGMPFQSHAVILVCQLPRPAVEYIFLSSNGTAILNETVDHSKVLSVKQFLRLNITLHQLQNAIGLQVVEPHIAHGPRIANQNFLLLLSSYCFGELLT